jgi:hypothetical protein
LVITINGASGFVAAYTDKTLENPLLPIKFDAVTLN